MNREEIGKVAVEYLDTLNLKTDNELFLVHMAFVAGAEWMQEQKQQELNDIASSICVEDDSAFWTRIKDLDSRYNSSEQKIYKRGYVDAMVTMMWNSIITTSSNSITEQEKNNIDTIIKLTSQVRALKNKVSELTEALDAAHVFCEGVKEHYIKKACKEFCYNCTHYENCEGYCDRYKQFCEAMKGE